MTSGFMGIALNFIKSTFANKNNQKSFGGNNSPRPAGSKVWFVDEGRSGRVGYQDDDGTFGMYWEFGGGDVIVIIWVPKEAEWEAQTKIPISKRANILNHIGSEAIRQKNGGRGRYDVQEDCILICS